MLFGFPRAVYRGPKHGSSLSAPRSSLLQGTNVTSAWHSDFALRSLSAEGKGTLGRCFIKIAVPMGTLVGPQSLFLVSLEPPQSCTLPLGSGIGSLPERCSRSLLGLLLVLCGAGGEFMW